MIQLTALRVSDRRNIVVIADEAQSSQYDFIDGFARRLLDAMLTEAQAPETMQEEAA